MLHIHHKSTKLKSVQPGQCPHVKVILHLQADAKKFEAT